MLANAKYTYALNMWTVEKRPNGWYFSNSAYHNDKHDWRGPYRSEFSVTLMIARELRKVFKKSKNATEANSQLCLSVQARQQCSRRATAPQLCLCAGFLFFR
jgi:hypothetical protein